MEYSVTLQHASGSEANAFDVHFEAVLPGSKLNFPPDPNDIIDTVVDTGGAPTDIPLTIADFEIVTNDSGDTILQLKSHLQDQLDIVTDRVITITLKGYQDGASNSGDELELNDTVVPKEQISTDATLTWHSLDGEK